MPGKRRSQTTSVMSKSSTIWAKVKSARSAAGVSCRPSRTPPTSSAHSHSFNIFWNTSAPGTRISLFLAIRLRRQQNDNGKDDVLPPPIASWSASCRLTALAGDCLSLVISHAAAFFKPVYQAYLRELLLRRLHCISNELRLEPNAAIGPSLLRIPKQASKLHFADEA